MDTSLIYLLRLSFLGRSGRKAKAMIISKITFIEYLQSCFF